MKDVEVSITFAGQTLTGFGQPVLIKVVSDEEWQRARRIRNYTHWTQIALVFGDEIARLRAIKWLKRKAWMRRKKRRGW